MAGLPAPLTTMANMFLLLQHEHGPAIHGGVKPLPVSPPGVMYAAVAGVLPSCSASITKLSLLCEHWSQLAQAFGQPAKGQPLPIHSLEPASFRLKRNSPAQGPTPQYRQHGSGDPGRQPQIFMLTPATVSASMTLLVYSIFIEQPVSGRTQPGSERDSRAAQACAE